MVIQHNIPALNSHRNLLVNNSATAKNLEKLSSGYRINRAGDDAAGLAISEKMRGQIRGLAMAENNVSMGINLIQTAEGGLQETHAILQRMRELAVQASNGTYDDDDRANLQMEIDELNLEIDRIAESTAYNGINLLNGDLDSAVSKARLDATGTANVTLGNALGGPFASVAIDDTSVVSGGTAYSNIEIEIGQNAAGDFVVTSASVGGTKVSAADIRITGTAPGVISYEIVLGSGGGNEDTVTFDVTQAYFTTKEAATGSGTEVGKYVVTFDTDGSDDIDAGSVDSDDFFYNLVAGAGVRFQIGCNGGPDQVLTCEVGDMSSTALNVANINIADPTLANQAIDTISDATNRVSEQRAQLGAYQNRLEHTLNNLGVTKENLTASESTIRDVDMAKEMMEFTKNNILVQSAQAMLAQATQLPQGVLQLLR